MFRVTYGDTRYRVQFHHDREPRLIELHAGKMALVRASVCRISFDGDPKEQPEDALTASGEAFCNVQADQFCRETGRKLALTRALDMLWPRTTAYSFTTKSNRDARRLFWTEYFNRPRSITR